MTKEEAKKIFFELLLFGKAPCKKEELEDLCKLVLSALEQESKTGHWIVHPKGIYAHLVCDKCLSCAPYDCETNYCPNCGAKMAESEAGE